MKKRARRAIPGCRARFCSWWMHNRAWCSEGAGDARIFMRARQNAGAWGAIGC
jgi:hypothetical protein